MYHTAQTVTLAAMNLSLAAMVTTIGFVRSRTA
jgi:hypothetical protein